MRIVHKKIRRGLKIAIKRKNHEHNVILSGYIPSTKEEWSKFFTNKEKYEAEEGHKCLKCSSVLLCDPAKNKCVVPTISQGNKETEVEEKSKGTTEKEKDLEENAGDPEKAYSEKACSEKPIEHQDDCLESVCCNGLCCHGDALTWEKLCGIVVQDIGAEATLLLMQPFIKPGTITFQFFFSCVHDAVVNKQQK